MFDLEINMISWIGGAWGAPEYWWWVIWLFCLVVLVWYAVGWRVRIARLLDSTGALLRHFSVWRVVAKGTLLTVALVSIYLALLHPKWGVVQEIVEQQGRDVFVALDISRSMLARDVAPDRLSVAKQAIKHILEALPADRIGLMIFGQKAQVHCPLTHDRELLTLFVEHIDQTIISAGTTRLDGPIALAIAQCCRTPGRKSRLLVILTDGEDFSGALQSLAVKAAQERLMILVVGVGTMRGAPIPDYDAQGKQRGFLKDAAQHVVVSRLNEVALRNLAQKTGGRAVFLCHENNDLHDIVDAIERCEKEQHGKQMMTRMHEQYHWFLLIALSCLLLEWLL